MFILLIGSYELATRYTPFSQVSSSFFGSVGFLIQIHAFEVGATVRSYWYMHAAAIEIWGLLLFLFLAWCNFVLVLVLREASGLQSLMVRMWVCDPVRCLCAFAGAEVGVCACINNWCDPAGHMGASRAHVSLGSSGLVNVRRFCWEPWCGGPMIWSVC